MIITFLLQIVFSFLNFILGILPQGHLPTQITNAVSFFWGVANSFSYVFPVSTALAAVLLVISVDVVFLLWSAFHWILRKIPGLH